MIRIKTFLGYSLAVGSLIIALATFVGNGAFSRAISATGIKINPRFTGGVAETTLVRRGYRVIVHRPVFEALFGRSRTGFVQVDWKPDSIAAWYVVANDGDSGVEAAGIPADLAARLGRVISDTIAHQGGATGLTLDPERAVISLAPLDKPAADEPMTIKGIDWIPDSMVLRVRLTSPALPTRGKVSFRSVYWAPESLLPDTTTEAISCGEGEYAFAVSLDTRTGAAKLSAPAPCVLGTGRAFKLSHGWAVRIRLEANVSRTFSNE